MTFSAGTASWRPLTVVEMALFDVVELHHGIRSEEVDGETTNGDEEDAVGLLDDQPDWVTHAGLGWPVAPRTRTRRVACSMTART
jgi:hypothetical protein